MTLRLSLRRIHPSVWLLLVTIGLAAAFIGATLYANRIASGIDSMAEEVASNAYPSMRYLDAARSELHGIEDVLSTALQGQGGAALLRNELDIHEQLMRQVLDAYAELPFFPTERARWEAVELGLRDVDALTHTLLSKLEAGDLKGATTLLAGPVDKAIDRSDMMLANLIDFDADRATSSLRRIAGARLRSQRVAFTLDALAVLLAGVLGLTAVVSTRQHMRAIGEAREADRRVVSKLRTVAESALAITESVGRGGNLREALQVAAEKARAIAAADLVALGVGQDPSSLFDPFVFAGVEPGLMTMLGAPKPRGILGVLIAEQKTVQIGDFSRHPRLEGTPEGQPSVGPFLGVAVRDVTGVVGYLYLGRKPGARPFSDEEAGAVQLLAEFIGVAIQNSNLNGSLRNEVRAREDVLSMVSHDLRNPLSVVSMAAATAQHTLGGDSPARRQLDLIVRNAGRMDRMIGDLLTAAKLHEGKVSVEPHAQNPGALVQEAADAFAAAAANKKIHLSSEIANDTPPVFCDGGRIAEVLSNLLSNALKFTPDGGSIVLSVHRCGDNDQEVCFSVRDTGVGIQSDAVPHLFDRFWQKTEHAAYGTGLGLFICKGLVEAHHGRIWVTSLPGQGSEFQFALPAADVRTV